MSPPPARAMPALSSFSIPTRSLILHPDRLFPTNPAVRAFARHLYDHVATLPIISPHGHTDPMWFALDAPFTNTAELQLPLELPLALAIIHDRTVLTKAGLHAEQMAAR